MNRRRISQTIKTAHQSLGTYLLGKKSWEMAHMQRLVPLIEGDPIQIQTKKPEEANHLHTRTLDADAERI